MNKKLVEHALMGFGGWNGWSMGDLLGGPPAKAAVEDVKKLNWKQVMQLFHAAPAPAMETLHGEYQAEVLNVGKLAFLASFTTHSLFGPGRWLGKAFLPQDGGPGWGCNLFMLDDGRVVRTRKMDTSIGVSRFDGRDSFHLDYSAHNPGLFKTMRDEIRQINDELFIGLGHMAPGGGPVNPAPFVLYGKPSPWVGMD